MPVNPVLLTSNLVFHSPYFVDAHHVVGVSNSSRIHPFPDIAVGDNYDTSTIGSRTSHYSSAEWAFQSTLRPQDVDPGSFKAQVQCSVVAFLES